MNLLKDLAKASGNDLAGVVSDGIVAGDVDGYIDTGSYIFNALVSGDISVSYTHLTLPTILLV